MAEDTETLEKAPPIDEEPSTFDPPPKEEDQAKAEETPGDETPPEEIESADADEKVDDARTEEPSVPPVSEIPSFRPRPVANMAVQMGMSPAEAQKFVESFDSPARAQEALQLMAAGVDAKKPKPKAEEPPAKAAKPGRVRFEVGEDEDIDPALAKRLDAGFVAMQEQHAKEIADLRKQLSEAGDQSEDQRRQEAQAQLDANVKQFDEQIAALGEEYHGQVGEGPSRSFDLKTPERQKREQVFGIQNALEIGLTQLTSEVPSRATLFKWAKLIVLDEEDTGTTRKKLVKKIKKRSVQAIGKPEAGRDRVKTKYEVGIANVQKKLDAIRAGRSEEE